MASFRLFQKVFSIFRMIQLAFSRWFRPTFSVYRRYFDLRLFCHWPHYILEAKLFYFCCVFRHCWFRATFGSDAFHYLLGTVNEVNGTE